MTGFDSAQFKERLRAGCHAAVLRNPEWRQQARNTSRNNRRRGFRRLWSWLLTALFASAVAAGLARQSLGDELATPVIGLALGAMTLGLYIMSRHQLALACFGHHDL